MIINIFLKKRLPDRFRGATIRMIVLTLFLHRSSESITLAAYQHLVILTYYPEPGTMRANLTAALGEQGAVRLQRSLTEHTLETARAFLRAHRDIRSIELRCVGAEPDTMRAWLGNGVSYTTLSGGEPGEWFTEASNAAFDTGAEMVLLMGTGTALAPGFDRVIRNQLDDPGVACGAFSPRFDSPLLKHRAMECWSWFRSHILHLPGLAQGLFMRSQTLRQAGGIPKGPVLGEFEIAHRLARHGRIVIVPQTATITP